MRPTNPGGEGKQHMGKDEAGAPGGSETLGRGTPCPVLPVVSRVGGMPCQLLGIPNPDLTAVCTCARSTVQAVSATGYRSSQLLEGSQNPEAYPHLPTLPPGSHPQPSQLPPDATCCALMGGCPAHLEGDVVEVAAAAKRGPAGLRGPVERRLGARACSPGARQPGPIGGRKRGGRGCAGPLALGGLLPGHGRQAFSALSLQPPHPRSRNGTRTRPAAAATAAAASRAPDSPPPLPRRPTAPQPLSPGLLPSPPMATLGRGMQMSRSLGGGVRRPRYSPGCARWCTSAGWAQLRGRLRAWAGVWGCGPG